MKEMKKGLNGENRMKIPVDELEDESRMKIISVLLDNARNYFNVKIPIQLIF